VSAGHIVTTPSLGFHLTVFVRTHRAEAEPSFDFEPEDIHADWFRNWLRPTVWPRTPIWNS
jgi:hypothetical protein